MPEVTLRLQGSVGLAGRSPGNMRLVGSLSALDRRELSAARIGNRAINGEKSPPTTTDLNSAAIDRVNAGRAGAKHYAK